MNTYSGSSQYSSPHFRKPNNVFTFLRAIPTLTRRLMDDLGVSGFRRRIMPSLSMFHADPRYVLCRPEYAHTESKYVLCRPLKCRILRVNIEYTQDRNRTYLVSTQNMLRVSVEYTQGLSWRFMLPSCACIRPIQRLFGILGPPLAHCVGILCWHEGDLNHIWDL